MIQVRVTVVLCKALEIEASLKLVVLSLNAVDAFNDRLPVASRLEFVVSLGNSQRRLLRATYLSQDIVSLTVNDEVTISTRCSILGSVLPLSSK